MTAFIQAAHTSSGSNLPVTRVVIHGTVSPCQPGNARAVAGYFTGSGSGGSAHYVVDPTEIVQCVQENVIAWHAPPNAHSLGVELSDPQTGDPNRWADANHDAMLRLAAVLVRDLCNRHGVPVVKLSPADLLAGKQGICGHVDVSNAWHQTDHSDPGPDFPWDRFLSYVTNTTTTAPEDDLTPDQSAKLDAAFQNSAEARRMLAVVLGAQAPGTPDESKTLGQIAASSENSQEARRMLAVLLGVQAPAAGEHITAATIAAAVPANLAQQVADELAKRLAN